MASEGRLENFLALFKGQLGRAGLAAWAHAVEVAWEGFGENVAPPEEAAAIHVRRLWAQFVERHSWHGLQREVRDEQARTQARSGNAALVAFLDYWTKRIERLQQKRPREWKIAELDTDEVRDDLRETILTALLKNSFGPHEQVAREATYLLIAGRVKQLRKRRLITLVRGLPLTAHRDPAPTPEEFSIRKDRFAKLEHLLSIAPLTRIQRTWLESFARAVEQSELQGKDHVFLADAARERAQTRAAASRMVLRLQKALRGPLLTELFSDD